MRRPPPPIDDEDEVPRTRRLTKKPGRRWCKGRQGIEHVMAEFDWLTFNRGDHDVVYVQERCTTCGRHGKLRSERREKEGKPIRHGTECTSCMHQCERRKGNA